MTNERRGDRAGPVWQWCAGEIAAAGDRVLQIRIGQIGFAHLGDSEVCACHARLAKVGAVAGCAFEDRAVEGGRQEDGLLQSGPGEIAPRGL